MEDGFIDSFDEGGNKPVSAAFSAPIPSGRRSTEPRDDSTRKEAQQPQSIHTTSSTPFRLAFKPPYSPTMSMLSPDKDTPNIESPSDDERYPVVEVCCQVFNYILLSRYYCM